MKPLIVLVAVFGISCLITYFINEQVNLLLSGRIAMAAMLVLTAIGHFKFTEGMVMMLPGIVPYKRFMVHFTGVLELAAAIGILIPSTIRLTGILVIIFFVLILPSNIRAAQQRINIEKADYSGTGLSYLIFRLPLQLFFIAWIWWCCL